MSVTFDNTEFGVNQASVGLYALGGYTGTGILSGATPVTINGTIGNPGSVVTVNINAVGLTAVGAQGTYTGYSQIPGTTDYTYYFAVTGGGLVTPVEIAVTGATVGALNVVTPVISTNVTAPAGPLTPCFVTGTQILTTLGNVAVEQLQVGAIIVTASGQEVPIKWIGHKTVRCDRSFNPKDVWPIRISAHAFGDMKPAKDLFVSPGHAICIQCVDEVLIPAIALVNDATISQVRVSEVTYWHIELEHHDILVADGLAAESYIDVDNRSFFETTDSYVGPDQGAKTLSDYCRPFFADGSVVEAVRIALRDKAFASGWTLDSEREVSMHIVADGRVLEATIDANKARFVLPASAKDVWLISDTIVPANVGYNSDGRALGIHLASMIIDDGLSVRREIALNDRLLCVGFHENEPDGARWTAGKARLPADLWEACKDIAILQICFSSTRIPQWAPPVEVAAEKQESPRLRIAA